MKVVKILRSKKGFSAPWTVVIAISAIMFFVVAWQFLRLMTIAAGVKDAVQSAVISTLVANYGNVYDGIREGYSGGYRLSRNSWKAAVSKGNIYGRLDNLLGLQKQGSKHVKLNSDGVEFAVYGLSVEVDNAPLAPSGSTISQFSATSKITLEVPLSFCGDILPPMKIDLLVKSKYTPKF